MVHHIQPKVNGYLLDNKPDLALSSLGQDPLVYGKKNELLYWLDRGFILHVAGRYKESIDAFERAKIKFDELYTLSVTEIANSFLTNNYRESYRGHDGEYVWVNIFQALNYAALGDINESLVEARQVDVKLQLINGRYGPNPKNVYREDAFARLLAGVLYQAGGADDDARISFKKAKDIYERDYVKNYTTPLPGLLKLLNEGFDDSKAYVYLIQYTGQVPIKIPQDVYLPAGGLLFTKMSFPVYADRPSAFRSSVFIAKGPYTELSFPTELGEDIGAISKQILENRKLMVGAKSVLRPGMKLAAEKVVEHEVQERYGDWAALGVQLLGTLYNLSSEQADLRGWESLPEHIRIARLVLDPGEYEFFVDNTDHYGTVAGRSSLGKYVLKSKDVRFFIERTLL